MEYCALSIQGRFSATLYFRERISARLYQRLQSNDASSSTNTYIIFLINAVCESTAVHIIRRMQHVCQLNAVSFNGLLHGATLSRTNPS